MPSHIYIATLRKGRLFFCQGKPAMPAKSSLLWVDLQAPKNVNSMECLHSARNVEDMHR